eukprot:UN16405
MSRFFTSVKYEPQPRRHSMHLKGALNLAHYARKPRRDIRIRICENIGKGV